MTSRPSAPLKNGEKEYEQRLAMARILDEQWRNPGLSRRRVGTPFEDELRAQYAQRKPSGK